MPKTVVMLSLLVVWVVSTILAVTWGFVFDWPDYYHVNYGVPVIWATHTLNAIAGPIDKWTVDPFALAIDLLFWLGIMTTSVALMLYIFDRKD